MDESKKRLQEIFDASCLGIIRQGGQASSGGGLDCKYRLGDRRCAAGHLIPDDRYTPDLEGSTVYSGAVQEALGFGWVDPRRLPPELRLIIELQEAHDWNMSRTDAEFLRTWSTSVLSIGANYGLSADGVRAELASRGITG